MLPGLLFKDPQTREIDPGCARAPTASIQRTRTPLRPREGPYTAGSMRGSRPGPSREPMATAPHTLLGDEEDRTISHRFGRGPARLSRLGVGALPPAWCGSWRFPPASWPWIPLLTRESILRIITHVLRSVHFLYHGEDSGMPTVSGNSWARLKGDFGRLVGLIHNSGWPSRRM